MKKVTAIYQITIGIGMMGVWLMLFLNHQIPELQTEAIRITMHMLAEITTGILLLTSGLYILIKKETHKTFLNLSFGALIYTLIASPGYYAQQSEWSVFIVFIIMLVLTIGLVISNHRS